MDPNYALIPKKYLSPDEQCRLEYLLARYRSSDLRNTTLLLLMLRAGCRPQEALNIKWSDIDLSRRRIFFRTLKGGRPRFVPIGDDLVSRFRDFEMGEDGELVFKIKYNMANKIWWDYRPSNKKLHSLRHTFAVNIYRRSSFNLKRVQVLLGHRSLMTTAIYLEIEPCGDEDRELID